jgi:hypothetical protein
LAYVGVQILKKLILTLILILSPIYSSEIKTASKIMGKISSVLIKKENTSVLTNDARNEEIVSYSMKMKNISSCNNADMIITHTKDIPKCDKEVLIFVTNYLAFKALPEAVGAFFYQKGRPNIIFREENLAKYNIVLPSEFNKYIE